MTTCEWRHEKSDDTYETECENIFSLMNDGTLEDNGYRFCPYCGDQIVLKPEADNAD